MQNTLFTPPQGPAVVSLAPTRSQNVRQFFVGLALGLGMLPLVGGLVVLANLLRLTPSPLIPGIYGGTLLVGSLLIARPSHRFLGLGILTAILMIFFLALILLVLFLVTFAQMCQQSPAACG